MTRWAPTRLCGCGQCRFKGTHVVCPLETSEDAVWLWAQVSDDVVQESFKHRVKVDRFLGDGGVG